MIHTYESTYEDDSPDGTVRVSAEIQITYTVIWGCAARIHYDEHDHPAEADEIEIAAIRIEDQVTNQAFWRLCSKLELDTLEGWVTEQAEDMLQNAIEAEADAKAEAQAGADEARKAEEEWKLMDEERH